MKHRWLGGGVRRASGVRQTWLSSLALPYVSYVVLVSVNFIIYLLIYK